jgi:hypothetical protein
MQHQAPAQCSTAAAAGASVLELEAVMAWRMAAWRWDDHVTWAGSGRGQRGIVRNGHGHSALLINRAAKALPNCTQ